MSPVDHDELDEVAGKVAARYKRRASWADVEELKQVAWLAICRALKTWNPVVGVPLLGYVQRAATFACANDLHRFSSPVSAGRGNGRLRELIGFVPHEYEDTHPARTPDPEGALDDARWHADVQRNIVELTQYGPLGPLVREVVVHGERPAKVAARRRVRVEVTREGVRQTAEPVADAGQLDAAVREARARLRNDYPLWQLHRQRTRGGS
jgi:hypothetical protein